MSLKETVNQLGNENSWNGCPIGDMSTYHIINTLNFIAKQADDFKMQYELYIMESPDWPIKTTAETIEQIIEMDTQEWIKETPLWKALINTLQNRDMLDYAKTKVNILF